MANLRSMIAILALALVACADSADSAPDAGCALQTHTDSCMAPDDACAVLRDGVCASADARAHCALSQPPGCRWAIECPDRPLSRVQVQRMIADAIQGYDCP